MPQLLKPKCLEPVLQNPEKPPQEASTLQLDSSPHLPQLEKALAQQWRPITAKNKQINIQKTTFGINLGIQLALEIKVRVNLTHLINYFLFCFTVLRLRLYYHFFMSLCLLALIYLRCCSWPEQSCIVYYNFHRNCMESIWKRFPYYLYFLFR